MRIDQFVFDKKSKLSSLIALLCAASLPAQMSLAAGIHVASPAGIHVASPASTHVASPTNMNLSSSQKTVSASNLSNFQPTTINVGGNNLSISSTSRLTAAEAVAVSQVISAGRQSVLLNAIGTAIGGTVNFSVANTQQLSSLVIPHNVTVGENFGNSSILNISGVFSNYGNFVASSSGYANGGSGTGTISAGLIQNFQGASITSTLSHFNLISLSNITNSGSITASASMSLTALGSITNALPASVHGVAPVISATNTLSLYSGNGTIVNSGLLQSVNGNLNISTIPLNSNLIASSAATTLNIYNSGGILQANNGSINIGDSALSSKINTNVLGGDALSQQLNVFSGNGDAEIDMNNISGVVNINAGLTHVTASTPDLRIGAMNLSGDPTFYNLNGNVIIGNSLSFPGEDLAVVASGDIISDNIGSLPINISAQNITMLAGVNFTVSGGPSDSHNAANSSATLHILGNTALGGQIDLTNTSQSASSSLGMMTATGSITLAAAAGAASNSGEVLISNPATSKLEAPAGVTIIAGAKHSVAITADQIATDGGAGNIQLLNFQPKYNNVTITNGTVSGVIAADPGAGLGGGNIVINGSLSLTPSATSTRGGNVIINAGGDIVFTSSSTATIVTAAGISGGTGGDVQIIADRITNQSSTGLSINTSNGFSNGTAGQVYIQTNHPGTLLNIGSASRVNDIQITAQGDDGGQVAVLSAGNLQVNATTGLFLGPLSSSGKGAQIYLGAGGSGVGNLIVSGNISANGSGANDGGTVVLYSNSGTVMKVDAGSTTNGIAGAVSAIAGSTGQNGGTIAVINGGGSSAPGAGGIQIADAAGLVTNTNATQNAGTINLNGVQSWATSPDGNFTHQFVGSGTVTLSGTAATLDNSGLQGNANGGTIIVGGSGLSTTSGATFIANGIGNGAGGKLLMNMTTDSTLQAGGINSGSFSFTAQGLGTGAGGQVNIAGGSLIIDPSALQLTPGAQGKGASYSFLATNSLQISAAIHADGRGSGDGGSVTINSLGGDDFSINSTGTTSSINGTISALPGSASGNGGQITITTAAGASINVGDPTNISVGVANQTGKGGSITIQTPTISSFTPTSVAIGRINVNAGNFIADGGLSGGGLIDLEAPRISVTPVNGQSQLNLSAKSLSGPGGQITIASYQTALTVATGGITADASGTSGGTIRVTAGGDLMVDPASVKVTASAGDGGTLVLRAGNAGSGNLLITGALNVAGTSGNGGKVIILSNSPSPFVVNGQGANSIAGAITANGNSGGDVEIINSGSGGVTLSSSGDINIAASNGSGGKLNLNGSFYENGDPLAHAQGGNGPITLGGGTLSVTSAGANNDSGTIQIFGSNIILSSQLILDASSSTGNAGSISIMTTSGPLTIGSGTRAIKIVLDSAGSVGGALSVIAGGGLTVDTGSLSLTASAAQTGANVFLQGGFSGSGGVTLSGTNPLNAFGNIQGGSITIIGGGGTQSPINISTSIDVSSNNGTAGSVVIRSLGSSSIFVNSDIFAAGDTKGGSITISGADDSAAGKSNLFLGGVMLNAASSGNAGTGGTILVNVNSLIMTSTSQQAAFIADGGSPSNAGNGGSISIIAQTGDLVEGTNGGQFRVSAAAGVIGNGNGGNITLMAMAGNLQVNESLDLSGQGSGNGGKFVFLTGSTADLQIGSSSGSNFINGLSANGGNTGSGGDGGSITIQAPNAANIFITDDLSPQASSGNGGSVSIQGGTSTAIHFQGLSGLSANGGNGNGGSISISGLSIDSDNSPFTITATGSNGAGGSIAISTGNEIDVNSTTLQLIATGSTNGGSISLVTSDTAGGIVVQPFQPGVFDASGGNGTGPSYTFISGGNLSFQGALDASGLGSGSGGSIYAEVNSADSFDIGLGTSVNGFQASASISGASAGSFTAINHGTGGISLNSSSINTTATNGNGATVILKADDLATNGAINFTIANDTVFVAASGVDFKGGTLLLSASALNTNGLSIIAVGTGAGAGGTVVLRQLNSTLPINFNNSSLSGASFANIDFSGQGLLSASANPTTLFSDTGFAIGSAAGQPGAARVFPANGLFVYSAGDINIDFNTVQANALATNSRGANFTLVANPNLGSANPSQAALTGQGSVINETSALSINAQGTGSADGGIINIVNNSSKGTPLTIVNFGSTPGINGIAGLKADSGNLVTGSAGAVRINNLGADGIEIADFTNSITVQAESTTYGGNGGSVEIISTNGTVAIGNASINVESSGRHASGGTVTIDGNIVSDHNGTFGISAAGDQAAGSITFRSRSTSIDQSLVSSLDIGGFTGNAGSLTVQAGNDLNLLNTTLTIASNANGNGAILDLEAGQFGNLSGGIISVGTLSATGSGAGSGGSITLVSNSSTPFIAVQSGGNTALFLDVSAGTRPNVISGQNAGSISITNQGGALNINSPNASFMADTAGLHGNGGSLSFNATLSNNIIFSTNDPLSASAGGVDIAGVHQLVDLAIPLAPTTTQAGSIFLQGSNISKDGSSPLQLVVSGAFGGAVTINSQSSVTLGQGSSTSIEVLANAGTSTPVYTNASGVLVNIKSAGNLIVQPGGLQLDRAVTKSFTGSQIELTSAGNGVLQVFTPLNANGYGGGDAGRITLMISSNSPFVVATSNNQLVGSGVTPGIAGYSLPTITADSVASSSGITGAPGIITLGSLASGTSIFNIVGTVSAESPTTFHNNNINVTSARVAPGSINFVALSGGIAASSSSSSGNLLGTVSALANSDISIALNFNGSALTAGNLITNGNVSLKADSIDLRSATIGSVSGGSATQILTISPFQNLQVTVGIAELSAAPTTFEVSNGELDIATNLVISNLAAGITMTGPIDFSNSLPGSITFNTTGAFTPTASIVAATHDISITASTIGAALSLQNIQGATNVSLTTTSTSAQSPFQITNDIVMGTGAGTLTITSASALDINGAAIGSDTASVVLTNTGTGNLTTSNGGRIIGNTVSLGAANSGNINVVVYAGQATANASKGTVNLSNRFIGAMPATLNGGTNGASFDAAYDGDMSVGNVNVPNGLLTLEITTDANIITTGAITTPNLAILGGMQTTAGIVLSTPITTVNLRSPIEGINIHNVGAITTTASNFNAPTLQGIFLKSDSGNITLLSDIGGTATTQTSIIATQGTIIINPTTSKIHGTFLTLGAAKGFGSQLAPVNTDSTNITLSAANSGNVYLNLTASGTLTIDSIFPAANNLVQVTANNASILKVGSATNQLFRSNSSISLSTVNGNIIIGDQVALETSSLSLVTKGSGSILGDTLNSGVLNAFGATLQTGPGGSIGSVAAPLNLNASFLSITTTSGVASGDVFIFSAKSTTVSDGFAGGKLMLTVSGVANFIGPLRSLGAMNVQATQINALSTLSSATSIELGAPSINVSAATSIATGNLTFDVISSGTGNIGSAALPVTLPAGLTSLVVNSSGASNAYFNSSGSVNLQTNYVGTGTSSSPVYNINAGGAVTVTSNSNHVDLGNVNSFGAITVSTGALGIELHPGATLNASGVGGNIVLVSQSQAAIDLDLGSRIYAQGNVILSAGGGQSQPASATGIVPNITFNPALGGLQTFDQNNNPTNTLATNGSSGSNFVNVVGATPTVFLNCDDTVGDNVIFHGNVIITATSQPHLLSLDLSNNAVAKQVNTVTGGSLVVGATGGATAGSAIIDASMVAGNVTALNIPKNVGITFNDFTTGDPLSVNLTGNSTTKQVLINGITTFGKGTQDIGNASTGAIVINSNQALTSISVGSTGKITSGTGMDLSLTSNGDITVGGPLQANSNLLINGNNVTINTAVASGSSGSTMATLTSRGILTINAAVSATASIFVQAGTLNLTKPFGANGLSLQLNGTNMTQGAAAVITGEEVSANFSNSISLAANIISTDGLTLSTTNLSQTAGSLQAASNIVLADLGTGSFGKTATPVKIQTPALQFGSAVDGASYFVVNNRTGSFNVFGDSKIENTVQIGSNSTSLSVLNDIGATNVKLFASPATTNFSINLKANVGNGSGAVTLIAGGTGTLISDSGESAIGTTVDLITTNSQIGTIGQPFGVDTPSLSINTGTGNGFVANAHTTSVDLRTSNVGALTLSSSANLNLVGNLTGKGAITVNLIASDFSLGSASITTSPTALISIIDPSGRIFENAGSNVGLNGTVLLQANQIGNQVIPIRFNGPITINTFQTAFVSTTAASTALTTDSSTNTSQFLSLTSTGSITVASNISTGSLNLTAGPAGSINVANQIIASANAQLFAGKSITGNGGITTPSLALKATTGSVGAAGQLLSTAADAISFEGGSAFIKDSTTSLIVQASNASGTLQIQETGDLSIFGAVTGKTINLAANSFAIDSNLGSSSSTVTLSATGVSGSGDIMTAFNCTVAAASLTMTAAGNVGGAASPLTTITPKLSVTGSGVNIFNTGALTLGATQANSLTIASSSSITTTAPVAAAAIQLVAGTNAKITLNAAIGDASTTFLTLNTSGTGTVVQGAGTYLISAASLLEYSGGGTFGTAASPIRTSVGGFFASGALTGLALNNSANSANPGITIENLTLPSTGSLSVKSNGPVSLGDLQASTVTVSATGALGAIAFGSVAASTSLTATTQFGDIDALNGPVSAKTLTLNSGTGSINVGQYNGGSLALTSTGSGTINVFASSAPVSLLASNLGNAILNLTSAQTINVNGALSGAALNITSTGGAINVASSLGTASTSVIFLATGNGNITGTGVVTGNQVTLSSSANAATSGNIGSATVPLTISTPTTTVAAHIATSSTGLTNIKDTFTTKTAVNAVNLDDSTSYGSFKFTGSTLLNVGYVTVANGSISLITSAAGALSIQPQGQIFASNGNVLINNTLAAGTTGGSIVFGANSNIEAFASTITPTAGNVIIAVGVAPANASGTTALTTNPPNVTINPTGGGNVFINKSPNPGFVTTGSGNVLNATGANISISTTKTTAISLAGGVTITADPPLQDGGSVAGVNKLQTAAPLMLNTNGEAGRTMLTSPYSSSANFASGTSVLGTSVLGTSVLGTSVLGTSVLGNSASGNSALGNSALPNFVTGNSLQSPSLQSDSAQIQLRATALTTSVPFGAAQFNLFANPNKANQYRTSNVQNTAEQSGSNAGKQTNNDEDLPIAYSTLYGNASLAAPSQFTGTVPGKIASTWNNESKNLLLRPTKDSLINIGKLQLEVGAGAVVFVIRTRDTVAVYDLHDEHKGDVGLTMDGLVTKLVPGTAMIVHCSHQSELSSLEFADLNPAGNLTYRKINKIANGPNVQFLADFSPTAAFNTFEPLQQLLKSQTNKDRNTVARVIKSLAAVMTVQKDVTPYQRMQPLSKITSMLNP